MCTHTHTHTPVNTHNHLLKQQIKHIAHFDQLPENKSAGAGGLKGGPGVLGWGVDMGRELQDRFKI